MENKAKQKQEKLISAAKGISSTRGHIIEGYVVRKFPGRVAIEYERTVYVPKYERFYKKKSRIHARLPSDIQVEIGDYIKVRECRPLSKIIHHIVISKVRSAGGGK